MRFDTQGNVALFACSAIGLVCAAPALAEAPDRESGTVDEIVVTGSRIARRDFSAPSPIATVDRTVLDTATQPALEEVLNRMPQIVPDFERTANNPGDGTARINLRGLGSQRTLVLLNGRRLAPSGVDTAVDVNNLPQYLIDRVEIVTGGAAAVYGSDAVAGVVNFITRDDFDGVGIEASTYLTEHGDGAINDVNVSFGHNFAGGRGNITWYGGYYDRSELFASERSLTAVPIEDDGGMLTETGSLATPSSVITFPPVDFGNGPAMTTFDAQGLPVSFQEPQDRYNFAPLNYLQTPLTRISAGALLEYRVGESSEFYGELSYARNDSKQNLAPVPVSGLFLTNLDNPLLAPETQQFFAANFTPPFIPPGMAGLFLSRRLEELGPRVFSRTRDYSRVVAGLRGDIGAGWDYDVWLTYTDNDEEARLLNGASAAGFQQGLLVSAESGQCIDSSNGCRPLNIWGRGNLSAAGIDFLRLPSFSNSTSRRQKLVSGFLRGAPLDMPAGDVDLVVGVEWRSDDGTFDADEALFSGDALGFRGSSGVSGREHVYEVYAEAVVPLISDRTLADYVALELGARYSDYDNAGAVSTYKIGGEWHLVPALRLRAMFQHSVRAPNLAEAFQATFVETAPFVGANPAEDPCSASANPVGNDAVAACVATGLPASQVGVFEATVGVPTGIVRGGNPDLVPEEANTFTFGAVATLGDTERWQLSVDYFDLEIEDTIGDLEATVACFDPANVEQRFCDAFTRDPNNFNVVGLNETRINRGDHRITGVDTLLAYDAELPAAFAIVGSDASLSASLTWSHVWRNSIRVTPFGTALRCAGQFGFPCNDAADGMTYPEDRIAATIALASGALDVVLGWRWIGATENAAFRVPAFLGTPVPERVITNVGAASYLDLGVGYRLTRQLHARLNIANLSDRSAPLMADAVVSNNTDTRLYDIFGRSYSLRLSMRY